MNTYLKSYKQASDVQSQPFLLLGHPLLQLQTKPSRAPREFIKLPGSAGGAKLLGFVASLIAVVNLALLNPACAWAASGSTDVTIRGLPQTERAAELATLAQTGVSQWPFLVCLAGLTLVALAVALIFCRKN